MADPTQKKAQVQKNLDAPTTHVNTPAKEAALTSRLIMITGHIEEEVELLKDNHRVVTEADFERMKYIRSLPEKTIEKAFLAMEGMNNHRQAQVWDCIREAASKQQDQQLEECKSKY